MDLDGDQGYGFGVGGRMGDVQDFAQQGNHFENRYFPTRNGWWRSVLTKDFDGDGDVDILAGNLGTNNSLKPSKNEPVELFVSDFDENGQVEQLMTYYLQGRRIPFANHKELTKQLPGLKKKYLFAQDFSKASVETIFGAEKLNKAHRKEATEFAHVYFENKGNLNFQAHQLPKEIQFSTLNAYFSLPSSKTESKLILGGNFHDAHLELGRFDASNGHLLTIEKKGKLSSQKLAGTALSGQVKQLVPIQIGNRKCLLVVKNNESLRVLALEKDREMDKVQ